MRPNIVIGVGNILCGDDGFGVHAVRRLSRMDLPDDTEVLEAGCDGQAAATALEGRRLVLILDAIDANAEPGAIFRLPPEALRTADRRSLGHTSIGVLEGLAQTRLLGVEPKEVVVLAAQVADVSPQVGLTPTLQASLERVIQVTLAELADRRLSRSVFEPVRESRRSA